MEKAKHTPGPWETFPSDRIIEAEGGRLGVQAKAGQIVADCGPAENKYSRANARLIAAAPDMLEAGQPFKAVVDAIFGCYGFGDNAPVDCRHFGPAGGGYNDFPMLTWGDLRKLAAALAKAEGRS